MKKFIIATLILLTLHCDTRSCNRVHVNPVPTSIPPTAIPTSTVDNHSHYCTDIQSFATPEAGNERVSTIDWMPQVYIPAGTFHMGGMDVRRAPNEIPDHDVTLDAFWMDQLEVTNAMYTLCVHEGGCTPPQSFKSQRRPKYFNNPDFNDYPVIYVTWAQARTYCEWAGRRLPTEAEWEHAGRGDDFRTFPWGEDKADGTLANFNMLVGDTSRVGTYPAGASPFGVLDMAGNVAEWVNDFYSSNYANAITLNPVGPTQSSSFYRVVPVAAWAMLRSTSASRSVPLCWDPS
jgi:serine/threonine-protein kinase